MVSLVLNTDASKIMHSSLHFSEFKTENIGEFQKKNSIKSERLWNNLVIEAISL